MLNRIAYTSALDVAFDCYIADKHESIPEKKLQELMETWKQRIEKAKHDEHFEDDVT